MIEINSDGKYLPRISEFYNGKSVFLTGATGFTGTVLLELLLRCCPGIKTVYILLRPKRNEEPEVRKEKIFQKKVFERLKEENEKALEKIHIITGDVSLPNLGMSDEDIRILIEEVSVVFHIAANVQFTKSLRFMMLNIVISLKILIELCKKFKKLEVLVFTSTAYSNCNHRNVILKEEVYRLPFRTERFLNAFKNEDYKQLDELVAQCKPDFPNTYTLCKCLAENMVMDTASNVPIIIIRPSIIMSTLRNPMPGYQEERSGIGATAMFIGKGLLRVLHGVPNSKLNLVPVDIVANAHVLGACYFVTAGCTSPVIVNCTATPKLHITLSEFSDTMCQLFRKAPLPLAFAEVTKCPVVYKTYLFNAKVFYHHYLPAAVFDLMLKIFGKKPKLYSLYCYIGDVMSPMYFFRCNTFEYDRDNLENLNKLIHPEDRKDFSLDFKDVTYREMAFDLPKASPFFNWKKDTKSPLERGKIKHRRQMVINCIQWIFVIILFLFIAWIFSLLSDSIMSLI